jgi:trans-feruloyl-CoA hydratase/vanillin synthase
VTKAIASVVNKRDALYYIMTGKVFDGKRAAQMGLVNEAVPLQDLRFKTLELAKLLMEKNPVILRHAKTAFKNIDAMDWEISDEYLRAKQDQAQFQDAERGRERGMEQFLDEKSYRPGLENYRRED